MRIDGSTVPKTFIDEESGGIVLRRLHPRIANYNDLVIFLIKSNMEIKFIGSGEAAKALLYYITDYITKPSLPMHVGLGALSYAIQRTNEKFPHLLASSGDSSGAPATAGALTMTVNRMLSRQEISHQQVMSYLVGGGDVYSSHTFKVLHWSTFDRLFRKSFSEECGDDTSSVGIAEEDGESFVLKMDSGSISAMSQSQDYVYRCVDEDFESMSLYEFVGSVRKMTRTSEQKRKQRRQGKTTDSLQTRLTEDNDEDVEDDAEDLEADVHTTGGRKASARGLFSSREHTQFETHLLRRRSIWQVPVILGERIPRSDREDEEREAWARMMLILFVPWRVPTDLRHQHEPWTEAFQRHCHKISKKHVQVIANMNVLSECRDVRDAFRDLRRAEAMALLKAGIPADTVGRHTGDDVDTVHGEFELFDKPGLYDAYETVNDLDSSHKGLDAKIGERSREMLDYCYTSGAQAEKTGTELPDLLDIEMKEHGEESVGNHASIMRALKKQRRPTSTREESEPTTRRKKRRRIEQVDESLEVTSLDKEQANRSCHAYGLVVDNVAELVVDQMRLRENAEQERAFRMVVEQVRKGTGQLLMYIAGVGGTGKTHVIKSILKFFEMLGR
ncbi:hypothetical protein C2E23DRAFT_712060, partial [Lenzites betulinus]